VAWAERVVAALLVQWAQVAWAEREAWVVAWAAECNAAKSSRLVGASEFEIRVREALKNKGAFGPFIL
jgi:hypothetical protein